MSRNGYSLLRLAGIGRAEARLRNERLLVAGASGIAIADLFND
jgi:hypothetical protein